MKTLQPISPGKLLYNRVIGTGGIGSGIFFSVEGNETIGRNESRMASLKPYKDYCKLHIILHYLGVLIKGNNNTGDIEINAIGRVGNDAAGKALLDEMNAAGINTAAVSISQEKVTMFSVCFEYPDHAGGNITSGNSACSEVTSTTVHHYFQHDPSYYRGSLMLAAPEVPLEARLTLLEYGRKTQSLNVAAVLSAEVQEFKKQNGLALTDLLAINIDEARHFAEITGDAMDTETVAWECIRHIKAQNPEIMLLLTCGSAGVFSCDKNDNVEFFPAPELPAISTAGAGDAFLAGFIAGITCGLPFTKGLTDKIFGETPVKTAVELGMMVAAMSITSPDTIHMGINACSLWEFAENHRFQMDKQFSSIFSQCKSL